MESGLPTPPIEGSNGANHHMSNNTTSNTNMKGSALSRKATAGSIKPVKPMHKSAKRSAQHATRSPTEHSPVSPHAAMDSRHKRVWKACERCRMKKTKCDGEFPCKRCKDDGLVCTAGTRKKTEYKQLPRGYAEVLENTQFALIATVHKLYAMVRSGQSWDLGEPELNDRGQPVIHDIATKLGCIRPNADADLPPHSVFPEDEAGLAKLAAELEVQQRERERERQATASATSTSTTTITAAAGAHVHDHDLDLCRSETDSTCNRTERASSSELDHSDFEQDYRRALLGGGQQQNLQTLSPQSFTTSYSDFETKPVCTSPDMEIDPVMYPVPHQPHSHSHSQHAHSHPQQHSPTGPPPASSFPPSWPAMAASRPASMSLSSQYMPQMDLDLAELMLSQGVVESEFGTIKPHILSCSNPEAMASGFDPMIYSGYGMESLRS